MFIRLTSLAFVCCHFFNVYSYENSSTLNTDKNSCEIQIEPSQIAFRKEGMYYITQNGTPIKISTIQFENGKYLARTEKNILEDILGMWWCYNCQHYNSKFDEWCVYCNTPK